MSHSPVPTAPQRGALTGVTVLELDNGLAQYCGKLLADLGAEVIKIEPPGGAPARRVPPFASGMTGPNASLHFWHYNTNKRSVVLDLSQDTGRTALRKLAAKADVILDGLEVNQLDALGLGADVLTDLNPRLIYTRVTPFGQSGPWANYRSSDLVQLALGGTMGMTGYDDLEGHDSYPIAPAGGHAAHFTGTMAAVATLAALNAREHTKLGQVVDVAAHDVLAISNELALPHWEYEGKDVYRHTGRHANSRQYTPRQMFRCRDGKYLMCLTLYIRELSRWQDLVAWFDSKGLAEDLHDEKFKSLSYRKENQDHIVDVIERFCAQVDTDELFREAQRRRLPWGPVNPVWEVMNDPHLREDRGAIVEAEQPELGRKVLYPGAPYIFEKTPWALRSTAPALDADGARLKGEP